MSHTSKIAGIFFETNDDKLITEILTGTLAGEPVVHTFYLNYLLSYSLSILYKISIHVPWYGGMLALCHIVVYSALLQSISTRCKTIREYIFLSGGCLLLRDAEFLYSIGNPIYLYGCVHGCGGGCVRCSA